jgi:hypothetical protein
MVRFMYIIVNTLHKGDNKDGDDDDDNNNNIACWVLRLMSCSGPSPVKKSVEGSSLDLFPNSATNKSALEFFNYSNFSIANL